LKAIAVVGNQPVEIADQKLLKLLQWLQGLKSRQILWVERA